jgi:hypothetical protein
VDYSATIATDLPTGKSSQRQFWGGSLAKTVIETTARDISHDGSVDYSGTIATDCQLAVLAKTVKLKAFFDQAGELGGDAFDRGDFFDRGGADAGD